MLNRVTAEQRGDACPRSRLIVRVVAHAIPARRASACGREAELRRGDLRARIERQTPYNYRMPLDTVATDSVIERIVHGTERNPFATLGPHRADASRTVVRVFRPDAAAVELLTENGVHRMAQRHPAGFFEADLPAGAERTYRLRIHTPDGRAEDADDPYRFGRVVSDYDLYLFQEGTFYKAYEKLGAHRMVHEGVEGVHFAVWAPNADRVSVIGDFDRWDGRVHAMRALTPAGVWEIFVPGLSTGCKYKYEIRTRDGTTLQKADPFGFLFETPPLSASIVWDLARHEWGDRAWMDERATGRPLHDRPVAIYEIHLGSWRRAPERGYAFLSYRELATELIPYLTDMGYTHVELLPVMEHPFSGSWGYQVIGFFAPTSRYGAPEDFKAFVDACHQAGIGVILDWVPGHFPKDAHGLARFDGTALYEHEDPRQGEHQDWGTLVFNYGRHEVRSFLLSNALFWLEEYHVDGLRVDAVASMLYLDYSRQPGQWVPNAFGGRENLDAIEFLRQLNTQTHGRQPGTITVAEESTSWPAVSRPTHLGGLGFTFKWNMGWMHDILEYMQQDPVYRRWAHNHVTFSMLYAYTENFILPFSHDEVVHMKGSLINKIPGDAWQKAATLRALYGFMYAHPGKKLLFMGGEFGQWREWSHDHSLDWHLLADPLHAGIRAYVRDLNRLYARARPLFEQDYDPAGFQWVDCNDNENSVVSLIRRDRDGGFVVAVLNFTPVPRHRYRIGVPRAGWYLEALNSDADCYGGSNVGNAGGASTEPIGAHGHDQSLALTLPPLSCLMLTPN
jgi:1,4-alpha-glucan branching enzyme